MLLCPQCPCDSKEYERAPSLPVSTVPDETEVTEYATSVVVSTVPDDEPDTPVCNDYIFTVVLTRSPGQRLGMDSDRSDGVTLKVARIKPGLVEDHNSKTNFQEQIRVGDVIVGINGVSNDVDRMLQSCQSHCDLELKIRRSDLELTPTEKPATPSKHTERIQSLEREISAITDKMKEQTSERPEKMSGA